MISKAVHGVRSHVPPPSNIAPHFPHRLDIQASSFPTGDGIYEGLDWLSHAVTNTVAASVKTESGGSESSFFGWLFSSSKA
jgi:hypothetical protein